MESLSDRGIQKTKESSHSFVIQKSHLGHLRTLNGRNTSSNCSFVQYTLDMSNTISGVYHPRNLTTSPLWNLLNNHFDDFVERYEQKYERRYGYFRIILRVYFKYNHQLLTNLCHCAYESLLEFLRTTIGLSDVVPDAFMTIHTFGEYMQKYHPHLHSHTPGGNLSGQSVKDAQSGG